MFCVNELPRICRANPNLHFTVDYGGMGGGPGGAKEAVAAPASVHLQLGEGKPEVPVLLVHGTGSSSTPPTPRHVYAMLESSLQRLA